MKHTPLIFAFIIALVLAGCSHVTQQAMIEVIGNTGLFETHLHTLVPISTEIPQESFTSVLLPVPEMWIFAPVAGATADGSVVMMVFASPQDAHTVAVDIITDRPIPTLDVGDHAWMGIVSETEDHQLKAWSLIIQRCQGVALVRMSKNASAPPDSDHLRTYAQALDSRMQAALCP